MGHVSSSVQLIIMWEFSCPLRRVEIYLIPLENFLLTAIWKHEFITVENGSSRKQLIKLQSRLRLSWYLIIHWIKSTCGWIRWITPSCGSTIKLIQSNCYRIWIESYLFKNTHESPITYSWTDIFNQIVIGLEYSLFV